MRAFRRVAMSSGSVQMIALPQMKSGVYEGTPVELSGTIKTIQKLMYCTGKKIFFLLVYAENGFGYREIDII